MTTLIVCLVLACLFVYYYVPRFITEIKNPLIEFFRNPNEEISKMVDTTIQGKSLDFYSFDSTKLSCFLTYSDTKYTKGTLILLHGIRSSKEHFIPLAKELAARGYNSVAVDSRAHGMSEGKHCTFGVKEKQDISALIDLLSEEEGIDHNIGVWGQSLGGAIALQTMGSDKRIKFGIIESTFSDFTSITRDYSKFHLGFSFQLLTDFLVSRAGKIADFDPQEASPFEYSKKVDQAVLIAHGAEDIRINIKYGKKNFSVIPSFQKTFVEIPSANHLNVWDLGGRQYFDKVYGFIQKNTQS